MSNEIPIPKLPQQPANVITGDYYSLPWILSFPRSGSHWVNCALERYTQRRRLFHIWQGHYNMNPISILDEAIPFDNYMWVQSHFSKAPVPNAIYIIRDPVDVMFSFGQAQKRLDTDVMATNFLSRTMDNYKTVINKWCLGPEKVGTILRYENFIDSPAIEFKKLTDFFGLPWDEAKAIASLDDTTKGKLAENAKNMKNFFHVGLESDEYNTKRSAFRKRFGQFVYDTVLNDGIEVLFTPKG